MTRRREGVVLPLFSFLDVLICTMGAMILLLLVTSRRERLEASVSPPPPVVVEAPAVPEPTPEPIPEDPSILPLLASSAFDDREAELRERAAVIAEHQFRIQAREAEISRLRDDAQAKIDALRRKHDALVATLNAAQAESDELKSALSGREDEEQKLRAMLSQADEQQRLLVEEIARSQAAVQKLERDRESLRQEIANARAESVLRKPRFEIVAYDGASGTQRRPILIECREDGLVFAAERIELSARLLNGFTPDQNPLKAGAEALVEYWTQVDQAENPKHAKPYVLLIVRPEGSVGFYVARQFMEGLNSDFGYELAHDQEDIKWPDADPQAVAACREAVQRVLDAGPPPAVAKPYRRIGAGRHEPMQIIDGSGRFHLQEVEEMRNSPDAVLRLTDDWTPRRNPQGGTGESPGGVRPPGGSSSSSGESFHAALARRQTQMAQQARNGGSESRNPLAENGAPNAAQQGAQTPGGSGEPGQPGEQNLPVRETFESALARRHAEALQRAEQNMGRPNGLTTEGEQGETGNAMPSRMSLRPLGQAGSAGPGGQDGPPASPFQPPAPPSRQSTNDGGANRKWGAPARSGGIGIERQITLHLYSDRIEIEDQPAILASLGAGRLEFQESIAQALQAQALSWGQPPRDFEWRPRLNMVVHPGGNQHYGRLKELTDHWGLSNKVEHVLE